MSKEEQFTKAQMDEALSTANKAHETKVAELNKSIEAKDKELSELNKKLEDTTKCVEDAKKETEEAKKEVEEAKAEAEKAKKASLEKQKFAEQGHNKTELSQEDIDKAVKDGKLPIYHM